MARLLVATFVLALTLVLPGCGASVPHGRGVKDTVREFLHAAAVRDGASACALLTDAGRAAMAAYPKRPTTGTASGAECEQTVEHLDRLPGADQWAAMADGRVIVQSGAGLDAQTVTVSYQKNATTRVRATGSAMPPFTVVDSEIVSPPFPVRN